LAGHSGVRGNQEEVIEGQVDGRTQAHDATPFGLETGRRADDAMALDQSPRGHNTPMVGAQPCRRARFGLAIALVDRGLLGTRLDRLEKEDTPFARIVHETEANVGVQPWDATLVLTT